MEAESKEVRAPALQEHLSRWGLQRFISDDPYFEWQRRHLSPSELTSLHDLIDRKRRGLLVDEIAFYDATASPRVLPVLYSQRYEYYVEVGSRIAARLGDAKTILDYGCGVGILTTYYASLHPDRTVVGLDRSPRSIERARERAAEFCLKNVRFECLDLMHTEGEGTYDLIVSTHALVQSEQDPGVPSRDWRTFTRDFDPAEQRRFEERTGIGGRLNRLAASLDPHGRMILFEKTRQLARRVPFQRALAARGLSLIEQPEPIRYTQVEEVSEDGPLYVVRKDGFPAVEWNESPEPDEGMPVDPSSIRGRKQVSEEPLYENHHPSAQWAWEKLERRTVLRETTKSEPDGRQMHVELGEADEGIYLYCANTFDQRQLVIVDSLHAASIETYYREILGETP